MKTTKLYIHLSVIISTCEIKCVILHLFCYLYAQTALTIVLNYTDGVCRLSSGVFKKGCNASTSKKQTFTRSMVGERDIITLSFSYHHNGQWKYAKWKDD